MASNDDLDKQLRALSLNLVKVVEAIAEGQALRPLGEKIKDRIRIRTRLGKGVESTGAQQKPLKKLSPNYVTERKRLAAAGDLSDKTSPKTSNLTRTGQMLDELKSTTTDRQIVIDFQTERSKIIAGFHTTGGPNLPKRRFLDLGAEDLKFLKAYMRDVTVKVLRSIFKR